MQSESEGKLKSLFAGAHQPLLDETFTAGVVQRMKKQRRRYAISQYICGMLLSLLLVFFSADIINSVSWIGMMIDNVLATLTSSVTEPISVLLKNSYGQERQPDALPLYEFVVCMISAVLAVCTVVLLFISNLFESKRNSR